MPLAVRRALYSFLAVLGFVMMLPLSINTTRVQAALSTLDPLAIDRDVSAWISGLGLLFLTGLCLAAMFLYLALSTGHPKAWRPQGEGGPSCGRCGANLEPGRARCPACDQQLAGGWP